MWILLLILGLLLLFLSNEKILKSLPEGISKKVTISLGILFLFFLALSTPILMIPENHYALFNKHILGNQLKDGKIIATDGEMGSQSMMKREGLNIMPFVNIIYLVEYKKII